MKNTGVLMGLLGAAVAGQAGNFFFDVGLAIPDGSSSGLPVSGIVSGEGPLGSLSVSLDISGINQGAFNGDLYVTLQHLASGRFAVLVNRPGKDAVNPFGYSDNGLNVTLVQSGAPNLHTYLEHVTVPTGNPLTGVWAADNRYVDPAVVLSSTATPLTSLTSFAGIDPNGEWVLFAADLESGGQARLNSWSLNLVPIPEPQFAALLAAFGLGAWVLHRRRQARP